MAEDYWIKREREHIEKSIKDDKAKLKLIKRNYDRAYAEIDKEIQAFYQRYATKEGITMSEVVKKVSKADVQAFSSKAKKYVKEKNFTPQANEQLRLYNLTMRVNRLEMLKADIGLELTAMANDESFSMRTALEQNTYDELNRQAGILGESMKFDKKVAENIVNASFQNATFSQRIWSNQDVLKLEIDKLLTRGMIQGKNPKVLARDVRKRFDVSRYQAERLMITELARVQTGAQETAFKEYGYEEYTFVSEPTACDICKPYDGKNFKVKDMGGSAPSSPRHPFCKCSVAAYMDRSEWDKKLKEKEKEELPEKQSSNKAKEVFEGGNFEKAVGKDKFGDFSADYDAMNNERIKKLFEKLGNKIEFEPVRNVKAHASGKKVQLNEKSFAGSDYTKKMQVVYHESAHAFDSMGMKLLTGEDSFKTGKILKKKVLRRMTTVEEKVNLASALPKYNLKETIQRDLWERVNGKELPMLGDLGPKPRTKVLKEAYLEKRSHIFGTSEKNMDNFIKDKKMITDKKALRNLSDIMEGTGMAGNAPFGSGHGGSTYWKTAGSLETEFFAEVTDSLATNKAAYEQMKEVFPNAIKVWEQIADDIIKAVD